MAKWWVQRIRVVRNATSLEPLVFVTVKVQLTDLESELSGRRETVEFAQTIKVRHGFKYNFN